MVIKVAEQRGGEPETAGEAVEGEPMLDGSGNSALVGKATN
jgi:hypothetical protein